MASVRTIVQRRMRKLDLGPYDLAKLVKGKVSAQTIYNFLRHDRQLNTKTLAFVLEALDLHIVSGDEYDIKQK